MGLIPAPLTEYQKMEETESVAFNLSEKVIKRVWDINLKLMNPLLNKAIGQEENPIKMLMTEAYMEGFKAGNSVIKDEKISYHKGRQSAFKEALNVMKGKVKDD